MLVLGFKDYYFEGVNVLYIKLFIKVVRENIFKILNFVWKNKINIKKKRDLRKIK